jgi:hypothetical protein
MPRVDQTLLVRQPSMERGACSDALGMILYPTRMSGGTSSHGKPTRPNSQMWWGGRLQ